MFRAVFIIIKHRFIQLERQFLSLLQKQR